jgi:hypothetical protein
MRANQRSGARYAMKLVASLSFAATCISMVGLAYPWPAQAEDDHAIEQQMCPAPQDETGSPTEIPCAKLGVAYDCGQTVEAGAEPDEVWINHGHIYSDLNSRTITIYLPNMASRKSRRYPVIRYDVETNEVTLDGKPCHPVGG